MNSKRTLRVLLLMIMMGSPFAGYSQLWGVLQHLEIGGSASFSSTTYNGSERLYSETGIKTDSSLVFKTKTINPGMSVGGFVGTYFPVAHVGKRGALAISVAAVANMISWSKIADTTYGAYGNGITGTTLNTALPIGLDIKWGCEARQSRNYAICYTLGAGVYPSYSMTSITDFANKTETNNVFNVNPYFKAEVGILAGICIKLRAMYSLGNIQYINAMNKVDATTPGTFTLTGKNTMTVSLVIMPFSYTWKKYGWWNTANKN